MFKVFKMLRVASLIYLLMLLHTSVIGKYDSTLTAILICQWLLVYWSWDIFSVPILIVNCWMQFYSPGTRALQVSMFWSSTHHFPLSCDSMWPWMNKRACSGKKENLLLQIIGRDAVEWSPSTIYNLVCAKAPTTGQLLMCWLENEGFFSGRFRSQLGYICECLLCWWPACLRCTLRCCLQCRKIRWWWLCIEMSSKRRCRFSFRAI